MLNMFEATKNTYIDSTAHAIPSCHVFQASQDDPTIVRPSGINDMNPVGSYTFGGTTSTDYTT
jgi:hypothetical protein